MPPTRDLFASSSDDDDEELAQQLATASAREKRRDPHAFEKISKRKGPLHSGEDKARAKVESGSDSEEGDLHPNEEQPMNTPVIQKTKQSDVEESKDAMGGIRINKHYAAKYEEVKRQKELRQLTEKYAHRLPKRIHGSGEDDLEDEDDDDEEDEEDDDAVLLTDDKEIAFAKAFFAIRSAAPGGTSALSKESEQLPSFFPPVEDQLAENNIIFTRAMEQKEAERRRRFTLADEYRRGMTATSGAIGEEGKEDERHPQGNRKIKPQSAKERQLRESFLKSVADSTETFAVQPVPGSKNSGEHTNEGKRGIARDILAEAFAIHGSNHGKKKNDKKQKLALNDGDDGNQHHCHDNDNDADVEEKPQSEGIEDEDANEAFIRDYFLNELWKPGMHKKQKQKHAPNPKQKKKKNNKEDDTSPGSEEHIDNKDEDEEEEEEESGNDYALFAQIAQEEEDERFYADAEAWEREYQDRAYRHQDEAAANIQSFPRPIGEHAAGLLRRTANTSARKEARLRRVQRIEEMRERQVEELKRLKTLKRQEIESQRALIAAVAGLSQAEDGSGKSKKKKNNNSNNNNKNNKKGALSGANEDGDEEAIKRVMALWSEKDLDEDFDPKEFDKKMAKLFDEEYYDEKNVDEDEMAFFDEDLDQEADEGDGENETNEDADTEREGRGGVVDDVPDLYNAESLEEAILMRASADEKTSSGGPTAPDPMLRDDPFALLYPSAALRAAEDADFRNASHRLRASHNDSEDRVAAALQKMRADLSQREKEYWELHHDSTIDGGAVKTRFKYREVPKEDFLLPVEEILARDDRQLNMIVPMSCYAAYLDAEANMRDRARVARRVQKGFREIDKSRRSRRYGDVGKTALVDMDMNETAGQEWAERVRDGLRRSRVENELDEDEGREAPQVKRQRNEMFAGNGLRGRGRGGPHAQHAGRGIGYMDGNSSARQGERGGRGRNRGR